MPFGFDPGQYIVPELAPPPDKYAWVNPPLGAVLFISEELGIEVAAEIVGPANATGGYGGWEAVHRPRRVALTEWTGREPLRLSFTVMFDGYAKGREVELPIRRFERLAGLGKGQPPELMIAAGGVIPHDAYHAPNRRWVIESLDWGDSVRNANGFRVRQFADVGLLQFVEDEALAGLPAVQKKAKKKRGAAATRARQGESLRDVAKRTGKKLRELKKLNGIRDGDKKLTRGRRIKLR